MSHPIFFSSSVPFRAFYQPSGFSWAVWPPAAIDEPSVARRCRWIHRGRRITRRRRSSACASAAGKSAFRHLPPATHHHDGEPSPHGLTAHHCRTREFEKNNGHPAGYEDKKVAKDYQKLCTRLREVEMDQALHHTPRYRRSTATDAPPMQSSTSTASAPTQANSPHFFAHCRRSSATSCPSSPAAPAARAPACRP